MSQSHYELFSHDADIGVRGIGESLHQAFEMVAMALTAVVCDPSLVTPSIEMQISCKAPDLEFLLVDWLNAIIYEMDTRTMLFSDFHVVIDGLQLTAQIKGELVNQQKHHPAVDIKGATYTALKVQQEQGVWLVQCIVDV